MLEMISHRLLVRHDSAPNNISQLKYTVSDQTESRAIVSCACDQNTTKTINKNVRSYYAHIFICNFKQR